MEEFRSGLAGPGIEAREFTLSKINLEDSILEHLSVLSFEVDPRLSRRCQWAGKWRK